MPNCNDVAYNGYCKCFQSNATVIATFLYQQLNLNDAYNYIYDKQEDNLRTDCVVI